MKKGLSFQEKNFEKMEKERFAVPWVFSRHCCCLTETLSRFGYECTSVKIQNRALRHCRDRRSTLHSADELKNVNAQIDAFIKYYDLNASSNQDLHNEIVR